MQFGLLASVVAVIPFLSTNPGSRSAPFLHLGFLLMMSIWVYNVAQNHRVSKGIKALAVAILVYHLVIPGVLTTARHLRLITIDVKGVDAYSSVAEDLADGETNLVIVNSPDFFNYYHRPFGWTYHNKPLPKKIQMLAPGLTALTIKRESETTYRLFSEEGFAMLANTPRNVDQKEDPHFNRKEVLGFRANNQIMTNNETVFRIGQQVEANGFSATVLDIKDDVPSEIRIVFEQQKPAVWQWYDWSERSFKRMDQLAVGESRFIQGPFDPS